MMSRGEAVSAGERRALGDGQREVVARFAGILSRASHDQALLLRSIGYCSAACVCLADSSASCNSRARTAPRTGASSAGQQARRKRCRRRSQQHQSYRRPAREDYRCPIGYRCWAGTGSC